MSKCHKCGKPVYFAERRTSLGYEWHPECLRCEECSKRLNPGQHAEHKGVPYCHVPCYSVLFGPTLFGHGSQVEAHTSFGKVDQRQQGTPVRRSQLEIKLRAYNAYFEGKSGIIQSRERNGRLILEGGLRIYWGVHEAIRLKEDNDDRMHMRRRCSASAASSPEHMSSAEKQALVQHDPKLLNTLLSLPMKESEMSLKDINLDVTEVAEKEVTSYKTLPAGGLKSATGVSLRRRPRVQKSRLKRRCSINGHFYNRETSIFTPGHGSVTSVWVTSLVTAPEVINLLLEKFKVCNDPQQFVLHVVWDSGECRCIADHESPLVVRVLLGPCEEAAKVFIVNKSTAEEISAEVAQYLNFSETELKMFLSKFNEEEKREMQRIFKKYQDRKAKIESQLEKLKDDRETAL